MSDPRVEVGDVYRWPNDDRPSRVLLRDADIVMYDSWWPHLDGWGMADLPSVKRKQFNYYVTLTDALVTRASYLRSEPLSDEELALHRPDLPFAVAQHSDRTWADFGADTAAQPTKVLSVASLYVLPFGPQGGHKAPTQIRADDGVAFTDVELLAKARVIQQPWLGDTQPFTGVGIYRLGLKRGTPAYYLWGATSRLHTGIADFEERQRAKKGLDGTPV